MLNFVRCAALRRFTARWGDFLAAVEGRWTDITDARKLAPVEHEADAVAREAAQAAAAEAAAAAARSPSATARQKTAQRFDALFETGIDAPPAVTVTPTPTAAAAAKPQGQAQPTQQPQLLTAAGRPVRPSTTPPAPGPAGTPTATRPSANPWGWNYTPAQPPLPTPAPASTQPGKSLPQQPQQQPPRPLGQGTPLSSVFGRPPTGPAGTPSVFGFGAGAGRPAKEDPLDALLRQMKASGAAVLVLYHYWCANLRGLLQAYMPTTQESRPSPSSSISQARPPGGAAQSTVASGGRPGGAIIGSSTSSSSGPARQVVINPPPSPKAAYKPAPAPAQRPTFSSQSLGYRGPSSPQASRFSNNNNNNDAAGSTSGTSNNNAAAGPSTPGPAKGSTTSGGGNNKR